SRYSLTTLAAYSTWSRSTRVGTEWYGLRSIRSGGGFCGSTGTRSYVTPLAANTSLTRWQSTSSTAENRVIALRIRGLAAIKAFSRNRNPPVARCRPHLAAGHPGLASPQQPAARSCCAGPARTRPAGSLVHVLPVFVLEQPCQQRQERQEQHDPHADALALERRRLAGVLEEGGEVAQGLVELGRALGAGRGDFQALDRSFAGTVGLAVHRVLEALLLPERVGHRGVREQGVVPAQRTGIVQVERLEVGVDPVASAHAGDQGEVRRDLPEPLGRMLGRHRGNDVLAEAGAGEVEVGHHLLLGQAQVLGHARRAQVLERVAACAVVHVQLRAALQRGPVADVRAGLQQGAAATGGERGERQEHAAGDRGDAGEEGLI